MVYRRQHFQTAFFPPLNKLGINGMNLIETFYLIPRTESFYKEEHRFHNNNIREK